MKTKDCDSTKMCCLIFLTDSFISSDGQGCYNSVSDDVDLLLVFQLSSGRGNASVVKMVSQVTKLVYRLAAIAQRSLSSYLYSSCSFFMRFPPDTCSWHLPPPRGGTCRAEPAEDSLLLFLGLVSAGLLSWFTSPRALKSSKTAGGKWTGAPASDGQRQGEPSSPAARNQLVWVKLTKYFWVFGTYSCLHL